MIRGMLLAMIMNIKLQRGDAYTHEVHTGRCSKEC
jgi:hypothetical protein